MDINEKVAYIRGLTDGLKLNDNDDTVKVLKAVIDLLEDLSDEVTELGELYDDLSDQVEEIDQDLSIVEDDLYDDEDDFDDFDEEGEYYEVVCPKCGDGIIYGTIRASGKKAHCCTRCRSVWYNPAWLPKKPE